MNEEPFQTTPVVAAGAAKILASGLVTTKLILQFNAVMEEARRKDTFRFIRQGARRVNLPTFQAWKRAEHDRLVARVREIVLGDPAFVLAVIRGIQEVTGNPRASSSLYRIVCTLAGMKALVEFFQEKAQDFLTVKGGVSKKGELHDKQSH